MMEKDKAIIVIPQERAVLILTVFHLSQFSRIGQGSQFVGMGKDLYDTYSVARQVVDEADEALGGTLKHVMFEGSQEDLTRTENAQPAILTTSIAMLRVLESERGFKIEDTCKHALGHSLGEYSALVATKAVTLHDAVKLVVSIIVSDDACGEAYFPSFFPICFVLFLFWNTCGRKLEFPWLTISHVCLWRVFLVLPSGSADKQ